MWTITRSLTPRSAERTPLPWTGLLAKLVEKCRKVLKSDITSECKTVTFRLDTPQIKPCHADTPVSTVLFLIFSPNVAESAERCTSFRSQKCRKLHNVEYLKFRIWPVCRQESAISPERHVNTVGPRGYTPLLVLGAIHHCWVLDGKLTLLGPGREVNTVGSWTGS